MSKWEIVSKETFNDFNKNNLLIITNHKKGFKYYGNASNVGISKTDKTNYYISSDYIINIEKKRYEFKLQLKEIGNNEMFEAHDTQYGIDEINAFEKSERNNRELGYQTIDILSCKQIY